MMRILILALTLLFFLPVSFAGVHMPCNEVILDRCYPQPCGVGNKTQEKREECEDTCIRAHKLESRECADKIEENYAKDKKTILKDGKNN